MLINTFHRLAAMVEEEEAALRDAEASLLEMQKEMEALVATGDELEERAFRRQLKELEKREQAVNKEANDALEEAEVVVEDLSEAGGREAEEGAALEEVLALSKTTCARRRAALRSARVAAHQALADRTKQQRNSLLSGSAVRKRVTVGGDTADGMASTLQSPLQLDFQGGC